MEEYKAVLTGEPFLYNETKIIGKYILSGESPEKVRKKNIKENLIQYKKVNSISRVNSPIFKRLEVLNKEQLNLFINGDLDQSKYILVYAIMKTDKLVKDFIREVYYDKLLMRDISIEKYEIDKWFANKFESNTFLKEKSEATKYKLKQVMMQIMNASGLVKKEKNNYLINRPLISDELFISLKKTGDEEYAKTIGGII